MRESIVFIMNNWMIVFPMIFGIIVVPFILSKRLPNNSNVQVLKKTSKIVLTNGVNLLIIFSVTYIAAVIGAVVIDKFSFGLALFGAIYLVLGYGIMFWIGFILLIIILDILLFGIDRQKKYLNAKLLLEWILISSPFIYWIIKYQQWIFLVAIIAFFIGQIKRKPKILRIISDGTK